MKKLLFIIAMMLPAFTFANNNTSAVELKNESTMVSSENYDYNLGTVTISSNDVTLPLSITVPAPHNGYEVIGIYGPVQPNCGTWSVSNGYLTITYTRAMEIFELEIPQNYSITVATYNRITQEYRNYAITLIVQ